MAARLVIALLLATLAAGCSSAPQGYGETGLAYAPRMDSKCKIAVQDCARPVALDKGKPALQVI